MTNALPKPSKIVIRTPNWLGDLMMSTAFVEAVLARFPEAETDLIVRAGFENLPLPHRGRAIPFDKKKNSLFWFARGLAREKYDRIYILPPSFSSAWMAFWAGIPARIGYGGGGRAFLLKPLSARRVPARSRHLVEEYLDLLEEGFSASDFQPRLAVSSAWADEVLQGGFQNLPEDFAVMAPGAVYGPAKQWPLANFRRLNVLLSRSGRRTVIAGTESDRRAGEELADGVPGTINLCGRTSLVEMIAVLSKAKLLVSNDSGAMHVAAALRKPQVAIFGSTSTIWTPPLNSKAEVLSLNLSCAPCHKRTCPLGHYQCLKNISAETVMEKVDLLCQELNNPFPPRFSKIEFKYDSIKQEK